MKKTRWFLAILFMATAMCFLSCRMSTSRLAQEVQSSIIEHYRDQGTTIKVKKDLILTHIGGNEYAGMMTISAYRGGEKVSVSVIYDGKTYQCEWEIE